MFGFKFWRDLPWRFGIVENGISRLRDDHGRLEGKVDAFRIECDRRLNTWSDRTQLVSNDLGKTDQRVACLEGTVRDLINYLDRQAGDRARTGQEDDLDIAALRRNFPPAQKPEDDDVPF